MLIFTDSRWRHKLALLALVGSLTACGEAVVSSSEHDGKRPSVELGAGSSAFEECGALVDGETYSSVIDAKEVTADQLRDWLKTRHPGAYSPSKIASVPNVGRLVVCGLEAPGRHLKLGPPLPDGGSNQLASADGPASVILLLGFNSPYPLLDTIAPRETIVALMDKLG